MRTHLKRKTHDDRNPEFLLPYLRDYRLLTFSRDPFLRFICKGNQSFRSVSTNEFGFRYSRAHGKDAYAPRLDTKEQADASALFGGSTAFGVGSSSDTATISSFMSTPTGTPWLSFAQPGYVSFQETLISQIWLGSGPRSLSRVVLLTGFNDLYVAYRSVLLGFDGRTPNYFPQRDSNEAGRPPWWRRINSRRGNDDSLAPSGSSMTSDYDLLASDCRIGLMEEALLVALRWRQQSLAFWAALAVGHGVRVILCLQPVLPWTGKKLSTEENSIRSFLEDKRSYHSMFARCSSVIYQQYASNLLKTCRGTAVDFVDLNAVEFPGDQWLFVDEIHLNDVGSALVADRLCSIFS